MESQAQKISSSDESPSANGWFQIAVPDDGVTASVRKIVRHTGKGRPIKAEDILKKLKQLKVTYGIDRKAIEDLIESVDANHAPEEPVVIAKGDVENGGNGSIRWCLEGITEKDSEFLVVPKVQIAVRTLPSQGKKGKNVFGKVKNPRPGMDQQLNNGDGVVYTQETDGIVIYECAHTGMLRYKSGTLSIDSGLDISADKLQVHMDIYAGKVAGTEREITETDIQNTLAAAGIKYGIDSDKIKPALDRARLSGGVVKNLLVAEGKAPVNGDDDVIKWRLDAQSEDVKMRAILPGQVIATIKSKLESTSGLDVFNELLPGTNGTEISIKCAEGVEKEKIIGGYEYKALRLGVVQFDSDTLTINSEINVSDDNMVVTMSLLRPDIETDKGNILLPHVLCTLRERGIVYGIKNDAIKLILENINKERKSKVNVLVAEGLPAKDGVDARIEFDKELSKAGKMLPDGRVDYHEKSYPWNVKVNDVIGKVILPRRAEDGRNVKGEELIANQVAESEPELEGIKQEPDGTLRATEDGVLLINGIHLKVTDSLQIEGDICHKTGNIRSDETVNVKGYVEAGFVLETKGDAIIQKNAEDATVNADGSVVIKSGIRGTRCKIIAGRNISASFAENVDLNAKGDIRITNSVTNCKTVCQGTLYVGDSRSKKGSLAGSVTHAYKGIESGVIGSEIYSKTIITAGSGVESLKRLMETADELKKIQVTLDELERVYMHFCKNPKPQKEQDALLLKLKGTRKIKIQELEKLNLENENLNGLIEESKDAKVVVHKRIYPGVKILISDKKYEVNEERNRGIFLLKGGQIIFEPT